MIDLSAADYCPTCGQPRERRGMSFESSGLRLEADGVLIFGDHRRRIVPGLARFLRAVMEKGGKATHEFLILRVSAETESNIVQVYVCRIRKLLKEFTGGAVELRTIWGWGYELCEVASDEPAVDRPLLHSLQDIAA
jgi:DNA-binding response OmpR family regulator